MPVCVIEGPAGLSKDSKKELIEKVLDILVEAYKMADDRVYINEYSLPNVGHTPREWADKDWSIQSENARVVCNIIAPPGLNTDSKRKMFRDITEAIARINKIMDQRDILVFLSEHPLDNVASNGFIQTENPAFSSPATMQN